MFNTMAKIAEQKIREAQERGEFDNLPGRGRPLELDDDAGVPDDMRMAYKILKNAGVVPPELTLKKEILQIEDMLASLKDEAEKYRQIKKLNYLVTKLNLMRQRPVHLEENQRYFGQVVDRVRVAAREDKGQESE